MTDSWNSMGPHFDRIWLSVNLATMQDEQLGSVENAALAVRDGKIAWLGPQPQLPERWSADLVTEPKGAWITPGLIECHTHLVYAGDRSHEFAARLNGATYEDIARAGGGILSTVRATRAASEEALLAESAPRARALVSEGVTTLEIKSGYGLEFDTERRMLRTALQLERALGVSVIKTFLGAHALPPEFAGRQDDYLREVAERMLPAFAAEQLIDAVDAFCERIAFTPDQTRLLFTRAAQLGLPLRLHADQLSDSAGGALAAEFGALSADHLEHASEASLKSMAEAGVAAVLLPAAYYYLREQRMPPIQRMRELNIPMAVSTDCNPGTAPVASLLLAMNMACVLFRLTATEVWRGVTINAARALGLHHDRGALRVGARADLAIWLVRHPEQVCAEVAMRRPQEVVVAGAPLKV